jgi:hypothetical protein
VTVALLPQFISFFGDLEEDSSFPSTLATTFLGFGEDFQITLHHFLCACPYGQQLIMV